MATEIGAASNSLKELLLKSGEKFSYFQALRLLRLYERSAGRRNETLRVRPNLTLGFPENDVARIEPLSEGGFRIIANFFGLYGVASPLPAYYTEDLFEEEREGGHVTRDFLDVIHYVVYPILFDAWKKYRIEQRIIEERDERALQILFSFVGFGDPELRIKYLPGSSELLRYTGLFSQRPRSVLGLQTLLADAFSPAEVDVESGVLQNLVIAADQRWELGKQGSHLGQDVYLGSEVADCGGCIRVRLSCLGYEQFCELLPGAAGHERLNFLIKLYLIDPTDVNIELSLRSTDVQSARTGGTQWSRLGLDTWIGGKARNGASRVKYSI